MKPVNFIERNKIIKAFIFIYLVALSIATFLFYFSFVIIPLEHKKQTSITNEKIEELLQYTDSADSLVIQIQKAPFVSAESLVPFYKWTNDLQNAYKQPFYATIISSYPALVSEIAQAKSGDTILSAVKNEMIILQKENIKLLQKHDILQMELKMAKSEKH